MNTKRAMQIAIRLANEKIKRLSFNANAVRLGLAQSGDSKEYDELKAAVRFYEGMLKGEKKS